MRHRQILIDQSVKVLLMGATALTALVTLGIILSILFESIRFFSMVPLTEFLFGTHWSPHSASPDQVVGHFGAIPLFLGSILITCIAMCIAGPIGVFAAIYTAFYASSRARNLIKPVLEMLAGVPTVVYGFFAIVLVAPWIRQWGLLLGLDIATESAIVAGLVMGIMIIPFISSLMDDVLYTLPQTLRDGSLGLGITYGETIKHAMLPAAFPGIASAFLLAISRAIGETMLVVMAAGMSANLTINPLQPVTTVTVQIVSMLTGDHTFDSPQTLAAFALGLALFILTFIFNYISQYIIKRHQSHHEGH
jgi:phosphate transport system permease protein